MMVEELTRQKEAVERRVLLKNVRMELMAKVEQTELSFPPLSFSTSRNIFFVG